MNKARLTRHAALLCVALITALVAMATGTGLLHAAAKTAETGNVLRPAPQGTPPPAAAPVPALAATSTPAPSPGGIATSIIRYVIQFPVSTMVEALNGSLKELFKGSLNAAVSVFTEAVTQVLSGGTYNEAPAQAVWGGAWQAILYIAFAFWPVTLALLVVSTAKNTSLSGAVGWADLKENLAIWVVAGILSIGSLYILNLTNGLTNDIAFKALGVTLAGYDIKDAPAILAKTLMNLGLAEAIMQLGGIFFALFYIILGFTVVLALIGAYIARYALMYVLIVIAPLAITLGVLPPLRWLYVTWLKGYIMVALIGPVNALLIGLASRAFIAPDIVVSPANAPQYFFNMVTVLAMLSVLITIDYKVAELTFGAVIAAADKAKAATQEIVTVAVAGVAMAAGGVAGGAGLGALGGGLGGLFGGGGGAAAGATAGAGGEGAAAAAGATSTASTSAASAGGDPGQPNAGANAMRSSLARQGLGFNLGAGLRAAGHVLSRGSRSWAGRTAGAAAESVGGAQEAHDRQEQQEGTGQQRQAQTQTDRAAGQEAYQQRQRNQSLAQGDRMINAGSARMLANMRINPGSAEGQQMAEALTGLSQQYGDGPVSRAAPEALMGVAAMPNARGGEGPRQMAQALGFQNAGQMTRAMVGAEMAARGDAPREAFPEVGVNARDVAGAAQGLGPTPHDYAYGGQMASNLRRLYPANAAGYAGLVYGVRSASATPQEAAGHIGFLSTLPDQIRAGGVQDTRDVWARFGQQADDYIHAQNLVPSEPDASWGAWETEMDKLKQS